MSDLAQDAERLAARLDDYFPGDHGDAATYDLHDRISATLRAQAAEIASITKERGALRQRVLTAEKAARVTMDECRRSGVSMSRVLLSEALRIAEAQRDAAVAAGIAKDAVIERMREACNAPV